MTTFSMSAQREREREGFDVSSYKDTNPMGPGPHLDEFIWPYLISLEGPSPNTPKHSGGEDSNVRFWWGHIHSVHNIHCKKKKNGGIIPLSKIVHILCLFVKTITLKKQYIRVTFQWVIISIAKDKQLIETRVPTTLKIDFHPEIFLASIQWRFSQR